MPAVEIRSDLEEAQSAALLEAALGEPSEVTRRPRCRVVWGVGAALAFAGFASVAVSRISSVSGSRQEALVTLDGTQCVWEGQDCSASKCCLDGGDKGLQCWQKDKFYAVCLRNETCKAGVQPGETHGTYDQYGEFKLDKWTCKKLGQRSKPACESFAVQGECPSDRCDWFRTGKCLPKCESHNWKEGCPSSHCVWDGKSCSVDPCSGAGEDCATTKCCSAGRRAAGQQCFQKNQDWSTCMDFCDSNGTNKGWSCNKIGERTPFPAPCSWAGKSCSDTHCCANLGFSCVKKDESYTGCVQTVIHTTWADNPVKLPAGWEGTKYGSYLKEHAVAPAPKGAPLMGVSMFCFMAVLPNSTEVALMEVAKKNGWGIFACNASLVLNSWRSSAAGWDTGEATLVNTAVFHKVWDQVKEDGRYLRYDWTIKADADCAFIPDRLRGHIWGLRVPQGASVYLKNTNADGGMSNGQFLGAIEVFSWTAVQTYFDNEDGCKETMGTSSGEDGFFKGCMDALGVGFMHDGEMLKPDFSASYCLTAGRAAFHPLKDPAVLKNCYNAALGYGIDWSHNTAPSSGYR